MLVLGSVKHAAMTNVHLISQWKNDWIYEPVTTYAYEIKLEKFKIRRRPHSRCWLLICIWRRRGGLHITFGLFYGLNSPKGRIIFLSPKEIERLKLFQNIRFEVVYIYRVICASKGKITTSYCQLYLTLVTKCNHMWNPLEFPWRLCSFDCDCVDNNIDMK